MSDIATLMARDPLSLTAPDIDEVILYFRSQRVTFLQTGKGAPKLTDKQSEALKASSVQIEDF